MTAHPPKYQQLLGPSSYPRESRPLRLLACSQQLLLGHNLHLNPIPDVIPFPKPYHSDWQDLHVSFSDSFLNVSLIELTVFDFFSSSFPGVSPCPSSHAVHYPLLSDHLLPVRSTPRSISSGRIFVIKFVVQILSPLSHSFAELPARCWNTFPVSSTSFRGAVHSKSSLHLSVSLFCSRSAFTLRLHQGSLANTNPHFDPFTLHASSCWSPSELYACSVSSYSSHLDLIEIKELHCHRPEVSTLLASVLHPHFPSSFLACALHLRCKYLLHTCKLFAHDHFSHSTDFPRSIGPFLTFLSTHFTFAVFSLGLPELAVMTCSPLFLYDLITIPHW